MKKSKKKNPSPVFDVHVALADGARIICTPHPTHTDGVYTKTPATLICHGTKDAKVVWYIKKARR